MAPIVTSDRSGRGIRSEYNGCSMPESVRVRFAPSPTGHLHVGGARTALFNWLLARHHRGVYVLRIEDTDLSRSTEDYTRSLLEALRWLDLDWHEGPPTPGYRQTERFDIYRAHAERLLAAGKAYRCRCTPETLDALRKTAESRKETFRYPGTCREANVPASEPHALRLAIPREGATVIHDVIRGDVTVSHAELDDWILVRTDGTPTYNFCVVVDDVTMKITHVIRGNDHLSNTPKQVLCYEALGYPVPIFAHIPMILAADKTRLSKRHGATSVLAFRDMGILPEAMLNYLARLGWSHGDQEIFSREDLVAHFDLAHVGAADAVFDLEKFKWVNHQWIKRLPAERLARELGALLERGGRPLVEMAEQAAFYLKAPEAYDPQSTAKFWKEHAPERYALLIKRLEAQEAMDPEALEGLYRFLAADLGLKLVDLAQLTRIALTGKTASPPIFEVVSILGKAETLARLKAAAAAVGAAR